MPAKSGTKKSSSSKTTSSKKSTVKKVVEPVVVKPVVDNVVADEVVAAEVVTSDNVGTKTKRAVVDKTSVETDFDSLISDVQSEIETLRNGDGKTKGVQFLRSLNSRIKKLKKHSLKIAKGKKKKTGGTVNSNSGFLKAVDVSDEMSSFAGWEKGELHSRVDVTRFICQYIKENNLQNDEDKRQIRPDPKLKKILGMKPKDDQTIPYFAIQSHIKHHFNKTN